MGDLSLDERAAIARKTAPGTLRESPSGVVHRATRVNDSKALWTPIVCGGGIAFPGPQRDEAITCPECLVQEPALSPQETKESADANRS